MCANRLRLLARHHIDDDEDNNTIHESENEDDDDDGDKNEAAHGDVALRFVADLIESELLTTTASEAGDFDNDDDDNNDDETNDEHAMIAACCCNDNNNDATSASSGATNLTAAVAVAVDDFSSCLSNAICVESALQVATAAEAYDSFAECLVAQLFDESRREAQDAQRERATQSPQLPPIAASVSTSSNRSGRRHSSIDMSSSSYQYNPHTLNGPRRRAPLMEEETATATALNNARRHSDIQQQQHDEWWKKRTTTNSSAVAAAASSSSSGSSNSCSQHNRIVFKQEQAKRPRVNFVHHLVCVGDCGNSSGNECNNVLDADIASSSSSSSTSTAIVPYAKVTLRKVSENAPMATKRATAAAVPAVSAFADDMMSMVMSESMRCAVDVSARVAQSPFVSQLSESLWSEALEMVSAVQLLNKVGFLRRKNNNVYCKVKMLLKIYICSRFLFDEECRAHLFHVRVRVQERRDDGHWLHCIAPLHNTGAVRVPLRQPCHIRRVT